MAKQKDSGALEPEQLSESEIVAILGIEGRIREARSSEFPFKEHEYLFTAQDRNSRVLLLDGGRGTGKTALLVTMAQWWNERDEDTRKKANCARAKAFNRSPHDTPGSNDGEADSDGPSDSKPRFPERVTAVPEHVRVLDILDFDPLPPGMPLLAGIVQAWRRLAESYEKRGVSPDNSISEDFAEEIMDLWHQLFQMATAGWTSVSMEHGLIEQVLERQEQVEDWQRIGSHWQEFVNEVFAIGRNLKGDHQIHKDEVFVIMIDDVDLQVERVRELLPALRMLYHPRVFFVVAADSKHMVDMLKLDYLGKEQGLAHYRPTGNALADGNADRWASALAKSAFEKVFQLTHRQRVAELSLSEFLSFSDKSDNAKTIEEILRNWEQKRIGSTGIDYGSLGDYLRFMGAPDDDAPLLERFLPYRRAHQIARHARGLDEDPAGSAQDVIRNMIGHSDADTLVRLTSRADGDQDNPPTLGVDYLAAGTLSAEFPGEFADEIEDGGEIVLSSRPDIVYQDGISEVLTSAATSPDNDTVLSAMIAVSLQDDNYRVVAPGIRWNIRRGIAWTDVHLYAYIDSKGGTTPSKYPAMTFQWRFHEHPSPLRLLQWTRDWAEFIRSLSTTTEDLGERIAYAWIYYHLRWLRGVKRLDGKPEAPANDEAGQERTMPSEFEELSPLGPRFGIKRSRSAMWSNLLDEKPTTGTELENFRWRTRTLPLLARPELGLPLDVQRRLMRGARSNDTWLRNQRLRLITDAIVAGQPDRTDLGGAESEGNVQSIAESFDQRFRNLNKNTESPWCMKIATPARKS